MFDEFLTALNDLEPEVTVCIIARNHDSAKRIDFARHSGKTQGDDRRYAVGSTREETTVVEFFDGYGEVAFTCFLCEAFLMCRNLIDGDITTYDEAVRLVLERENIDTAKRNILVSHQFYTFAQAWSRRLQTPRSAWLEGLKMWISGLEPFDYAKTWTHSQKTEIGRVQNRYCGTPLQYSVSEAGDEKTVTMVELWKKEASRISQNCRLRRCAVVRKMIGHLDGF